MQTIDQVGAVTEAMAEEAGRYLYCISEAKERASLGPLGIDGKEVYTIPYKELCAVVHNCPGQPYRSQETEVGKAWVMAHHRVVVAAWKRWGAVLPMSFDTIFKGEAEGDPEHSIVEWLQGHYEALKERLEKVRGKAEYGVQVLGNLETLARSLALNSPQIKELEEEMRTSTPGLAYLLRQRLGNLIRQELETKVRENCEAFYRSLRRHADDVRVERTKKGEQGLLMVLNLSFLVSRERYPDLKDEVDRINRVEGFSTRLTGPWPPYSFAGEA